VILTIVHNVNDEDALSENLELKREKVTAMLNCPRHTKDDSLEMTYRLPLPVARSIPMLIYHCQVFNFMLNVSSLRTKIHKYCVILEKFKCILL